MPDLPTTTFPDQRHAVSFTEDGELLTKEVEKYNPFFNRVEQVKKFALLPTEWTTEKGELIPTLKLKRKVIRENYRDQIDRIYSQR